MRCQSIWTFLLWLSCLSAYACKPAQDKAPSPQEEGSLNAQAAKSKTKAKVKGSIPLTASQLLPFGLDLTRARFKISYLENAEEGPLTFVDGRATVLVDSLPTGKGGTLKFELYDQSVLRLSALTENITLQGSGPTSVRLNLRDVVPSSKIPPVTVILTSRPSDAKANAKNDPPPAPE